MRTAVIFSIVFGLIRMSWRQPGVKTSSKAESGLQRVQTRKIGFLHDDAASCQFILISAYSTWPHFEGSDEGYRDYFTVLMKCRDGAFYVYVYSKLGLRTIDKPS
jgi:hypothetical protein